MQNANGIAWINACAFEWPTHTHKGIDLSLSNLILHYIQSVRAVLLFILTSYYAMHIRRKRNKNVKTTPRNMAWNTIAAHHFDLARTPDHVFSGITTTIYKSNTSRFHSFLLRSERKIIQIVNSVIFILVIIKTPIFIYIYVQWYSHTYACIPTYTHTYYIHSRIWTIYAGRGIQLFIKNFSHNIQDL
jgi:hypothetical protein